MTVVSLLNTAVEMLYHWSSDPALTDGLRDGVAQTLKKLKYTEMSQRKPRMSKNSRPTFSTPHSLATVKTIEHNVT